MKSLLFVVLVVAAVFPQDSQPPASPQDCMRRGADYARQRTKEAGTPTPEIRKQIEADRMKMVGDCAAAFDVEQVPGAQLPALIELYTGIQKPDMAERALRRGLTLTEPGQRAEVLVATIRAMLHQPKSPERNAQLERYADQLDAMPDALAQQIVAHSALNGYYRSDDIDAGIFKHSTWLIDASKKLTPAMRQLHGYRIMSAYVSMAEALAGQGENDRALQLLRRAKTELADVPNVVGRIDPVLARYMLVGTPAPALAPPEWLNREKTAGPLDFKGKVTLLQFTAHWCVPCKESYPGMNRLRERFKDRPFQVVFHTRTYGYFGAERDLSREAEIERDRKYFSDYGFDIPIAIGPAVSREGGDDPLETALQVGGIPQINVIDAKGNIRLIMIGYDDANEEKLATFIEKVLTEK
jgi:thiol-disulfide isomerase/thioredoxin